MKITAHSFAFAALATTAHCATLYLTGNSGTISKSTDSGASFATFGPSGTNYRSIAADPVSGAVFVGDGGAGTATARPVFALSSSGTLLSTASYDQTGAFNAQPAGYYNGFVYQNSGSSGGSGQSTGIVGFNGSTLSSSTFTSASNGNWQMNDMTFASSAGLSYMYYNGAGGNALNRSQLDSITGLTVGGRQAITLTAAAGTLPADFNDYAISASGRVLGVGQNGFWVSAVNQYVANSITLSRNYTFSGTENSATGDMGANARDFAMVGNEIFAVSDTNIYHYSLDDATGAISFVSANAHGFNSSSVQIAAIPEPSTLFIGTLGALGLLRRRRA